MRKINIYQIEFLKEKMTKANVRDKCLGSFYNSRETLKIQES